MKLYQVLLVLFAVVSLSSCVSRKQLTYLQQVEGQTDSLIVQSKKQQPYRLQINDLLSIRVKALDQETVGFFNPISDANPNATGEERLYYDGFVVNRHGNVRVPSLGEIPVLGLTVEEVREELERRLLTEYFREEANIFVTVKLAGIRYTIAGEIGGPGSNIIYRDEVTIMEAIASSGDIPTTGDKSDVIIIRQYPVGQKVHHINLNTIDAMTSPYYYVQPNDLIIINPLPQKTIGSGITGLGTFRDILAVMTALTTTILLFISLQ